MKLKLIARVAARIDAIEAARGAGIGWDEIAARLGAKNGEVARKTCANVRALIKEGKLKPLEQLPLPELQPQGMKPALEPAAQPQSAKPAPRVTGKQFFESLPQIGGKK